MCFAARFPRKKGSKAREGTAGKTDGTAMEGGNNDSTRTAGAAQPVGVEATAGTQQPAGTQAAAGGTTDHTADVAAGASTLDGVPYLDQRNGPAGADQGLPPGDWDGMPGADQGHMAAVEDGTPGADQGLPPDIGDGVLGADQGAMAVVEGSTPGADQGDLPAKGRRGLAGMSGMERGRLEAQEGGRRKGKRGVKERDWEALRRATLLGLVHHRCTGADQFPGEGCAAATEQPRVQRGHTVPGRRREDNSTVTGSSRGPMLEEEQAGRWERQLARQLASDATGALEWGVDLRTPRYIPGVPGAGHMRGVPGAGHVGGQCDVTLVGGLDLNAPAPAESPPAGAELPPDAAESAAPLSGLPHDGEAAATGPGARFSGPRTIPRQHAEVAWDEGEGEEDGVDWEAVRTASLEEVADVIKERGQHFVLAGRIQVRTQRVPQEGLR